MKIYEAVDALRALAHETRLGIFRQLVRTGPAGLVVSQIAEHIKIPPATLSFHLAHLQRAGLLTSKREGRQIIYAANYPVINSLMSFMTENCCQDDGSCDFPNTTCTS